MTRENLPARLAIAVRAASSGLAVLALAPAAALAGGPATVSVDSVNDKLVISGDPAAAGSLTVNHTIGIGYTVSGTLAMTPAGGDCATVLGTIICGGPLRDDVEINLTGNAARQVTLLGTLTDTGHAHVTLGDGNDTLNAATLIGELEAHAGGGADQITGSAYSDTIHGDAGDDVLLGAGGGDELHGGAGDDQLFGDAGIDMLYGDGDDDELHGGDGADDLAGGSGNDTFPMGTSPSSWDTIDGGGESTGSDPWAGDTISYAQRSAAVSVTLSSSTYTTGNGQVGEEHSIENIEHVRTGGGNDTLVGSEAANALDAGAGNDTIKGKDAADLLIGGPGADSFEGGDGDDRLDARAATTANADTDTKLWCNDGTDTVVRDPLDPSGQSCESDAPGFTAAPQLDGLLQVGQTLTASFSTYGDAGTTTVSWSRCEDPSSTVCDPISGAASASYVASAADQGSALRATASTTGSGATHVVATTSGVIQAAPIDSDPGDDIPPSGPGHQQQTPPVGNGTPVDVASGARKALAARELAGFAITRRADKQLLKLDSSAGRPYLFVPQNRRPLGKAARTMIVLAAADGNQLDARARVTLTGTKPGRKVKKWTGWSPGKPATPKWVAGSPVKVTIALSPVLAQVPAGQVAPLKFSATSGQRAKAAGITGAKLNVKLKLRSGNKLVTVTQTVPVNLS